MSRIENKEKGYITLTSVIILSMLALALIVSMLAINSSGYKTSTISKKYSEALYAADSCAEIALNKLQSDLAYLPGETITLGSSRCEVISILGSGNSDRTLNIESVNEDTTVRISVEISQIQPEIEIISWERVNQF